MRDLVVLLGAVFGGAQLSRMMVTGKYRNLYEAAGARHGVDPNLLHAIALKESRESPTAIGAVNTNGTRDYGLMQINDTNFARYGLTAATALDPARSVDAAAQLVRDIMRAAPDFGVCDVFSVYNAGYSAQDADPAKPGKQLRPKLSQDGLSYYNADYVRAAWLLYLLVTIGALAPLKTPDWT